MKKKILVITLALLCIVSAGCNSKKKDDDTAKTEDQGLQLNTNANVIAEREIDGLKIANISLLIDSGISKFKFEVTNPGTSAKVLNGLKIVFKNEDGKTLYSQDYLLEVVAKGETLSLGMNLDVDLKDATSIDFSVID